jgi:DNA (cytosine-5)-methyltransferase 1
VPQLWRGIQGMKVISTFAGCGGSSTGYKMAGCEVVACVEWDDHAVQCYRANHSTTKVFQGDIGKVRGEDLLNATGLDVGELDILDGSPPCQGFSTAGRRILDDPRNSLFKQQLRLIDELKPKHVVIENVSGMIKGQMKSVAGEIVLSLKERGYRVAAGVMEAQYFGVSQLRPRTFFIGSRILQPSLPKAISRPTPCRVALSGVEPDELLYPRSPIERLLCQHMQPGEDGGDVMLRLGRKESWWNTKMLHPDKPAQTLVKTAKGNATMFHWERRQLSIREAQVLTGFPIDYILPGAFKDRWARIGNSVAPPMSREIARQVFGA